MRVQNLTTYETADLRRLFGAGLRAAGASSRRCITVKWTNRDSVHGFAYYGTFGREGYHISMSLPRPPRPLDVGDLARVFAHEVAHSLGVRHKDMTRAMFFCRGPVPAWALGLEVRIRAPKGVEAKPPITERIAAKLLRCERALRAWEKRIKGATTRARKWRLRVRYYERRLRLATGAAAGSATPPKEED